MTGVTVAALGFAFVLVPMFINLHVGVTMQSMGILGALVCFEPPVLTPCGTNFGTG